jgi:two-component system phosphate regulon sensor histidine kinase PhoR
LLALAGAGSVGIDWLADRLAGGGNVRLVSGVLHAALFGTLVVGLAWRAKGQLDRLRRAFEEWGADRSDVIVRAPFWLAPVSETMSALRATWATRVEDASAKVREAAIRQRLTEAEREHAEAILDTLRDAVIVTDAFNEVSAANHRAGSVLGFDPRAALHKPIRDVIGDERLRTMIEEVCSAGVANRQKSVEHRIERAGQPGAPPTEFDVTLAALPGQQDGVGGVVAILRDVTREREISQMKSDFVSQASHELRTPLSSINAYVEMLMDGEMADESARTEAYQVIKGEAERVGRMIDNMLNISRIEAGIHSVDRVEVDFVAVCREVIETMLPQAKAKDIKLSVKAGPLIYTAEADRDMIYQVVMNLVSNGIKYTPEGGRVTVSVENDDASRSIMVTVADTGLGIPPDALGRVFEKFYRIESYKRVAKGTGLGLNLVKHIVETVHGGHIEVTSELGMGSKFQFTVPYEFRGGK